MDWSKIDLKDLTVFDIQFLWVSHILAKADVSSFKDNEIRCLSPMTPMPLSKLNEWNGILNKKPPVHGDFGMNVTRNLFWYSQYHDWEKIA